MKTISDLGSLGKGSGSGFKSPLFPEALVPVQESIFVPQMDKNYKISFRNVTSS